MNASTPAGPAPKPQAGASRSCSSKVSWSWGDALAQRAHLELDVGHPERRVQIAQAPLPVLELRLQEVDRVAEALVAARVLGELFLEERGGVLAAQLLEHG